MKPTYLWMRPVLGIIAAIGLLALGYQLTVNGLKKPMSTQTAVLVGMVIQTVVLLAKDCYSFYFGSSQGSANKAETIDELLNGGKSNET